MTQHINMCVLSIMYLLSGAIIRADIYAEPTTGINDVRFMVKHVYDMHSLLDTVCLDFGQTVLVNMESVYFIRMDSTTVRINEHMLPYPGDYVVNDFVKNMSKHTVMYTHPNTHDISYFLKSAFSRVVRHPCSHHPASKELLCVDYNLPTYKTYSVCIENEHRLILELFS
jgi:hypothetical protein